MRLSTAQPDAAASTRRSGHGFTAVSSREGPSAGTAPPADRPASSMPWPSRGRDVRLHRDAGGAQRRARRRASARPAPLVGLAMHQQDRRRSASSRRERLGCEQRAGKARMARGGDGAAQAGEQHRHRALAEPHQRIGVGGQAEPGQLGVDEARRGIGRGRGTPARTRAGVRSARLNHCRPIGAMSYGSGASGATNAHRAARAPSRARGRSGRGRRRPARGTAPPAGAARRPRPGPQRGPSSVGHGPCQSSPFAAHADARYEPPHVASTTRFAPSPTGFLHLGHALAALIAWRRAREAGGRFLLRLEDIDPAAAARNSPPRSWRTCAWLGLDWDGAVRVQSEHLADYSRRAGRAGRRAACSIRASARAPTSRARSPPPQRPRTPDGAGLSRHLPPACRQPMRAARIAAGEPHALRLDMRPRARAWRRRR